MKPIILALFFLITANVFSQDTYFQKSDPQAKELAVKLTEKYNKDIGLTGKQQLLFQKKVEEFLIKRNRIEKEYTGKEKLNMLLMMQNEENHEMHDILTEPQMDFYKKAKAKLQPIETVKAETLQKK